MFNKKSIDKEIILFTYKISRLIRKHIADTSHIAEEPSMLQLQTLMSLTHGALTMGKIAQELYIKLPTASSLVDRLIEVGYVKRISDKLDRRITKIDLTEKGKQILTSAMKIKMKKMEFILNKLSTSEKKSLMSIIKNLHNKLEIHS